MSTFGETVVTDDFKRDVICSFDPITAFSKNAYRFYAFTVYSPKDSKQIFVSLDRNKKNREEIFLSEEEKKRFDILVNNPQFIGSRVFFNKNVSKIFYFYWYDGDLKDLNNEIKIEDIQLNLRDNE